MPIVAQSSRFATILLRLQARLVTDLTAASLLNASKVKIARGSGYTVPAFAERVVTLRPLGGALFSETGAGRRAIDVTRMIAVDIMTRDQNDPYGEDAIALATDAGHFDLEEAVTISATLRVLLSDTNTPLTVEPLHVTQPTSDPDSPELSRYQGYIVSTVYFEAKYVLPIDTLNLAPV